MLCFHDSKAIPCPLNLPYINLSLCSSFILSSVNVLGKPSVGRGIEFTKITEPLSISDVFCPDVTVKSQLPVPALYTFAEYIILSEPIITSPVEGHDAAPAPLTDSVVPVVVKSIEVVVR